MALSLTTTMTIEGGDVIAQTAARLRNPQAFMRNVGLLGLKSASHRLETQLRMGGAERSGRLMASLSLGGPGNVFELSDTQVEVGTNLNYAAQVNFGGPIFPKPGNRALAIPLRAALKRSGQSPRDIDPDRILLQFVPYRGGRPEIIGFLVDPGEEAVTPKRKKPTTKKGGTTGYGPGPLFILMSSVYQLPNPFLFWSEEDQRIVEEEMWPAFLAR